VSDPAAFPLPQNLVESSQRDTFPDRREWVAELPATVERLVERWSLDVGAPFQPGGECSWVAPARDGSGQDLVLKVGWRHPEARDEAAGLARWAGDGAVLLHAADSFDDTSALLLERCRPGTTLGTLVAEPEQDVIVAGLLLRLWQAPEEGHGFRSLREMCDQWADEFDEKFAARAPAYLDSGLARAGMELFRELPVGADREVLLCTDLHAGNILAAEREPWLLIDPKPYVGDPAYDPLQHMLNCEERLVNDPLGFARRLADLLDLDVDRLLTWLFARCVQESIDRPVLAQVARQLAPR